MLQKNPRRRRSC